MQASGPTVAVGAVVVRDGELLMVRRGREPGKGLWSLPGGRVERGEYLVDAVAREVQEETGLEVEVDDLLGIFEVVGADTHYVIHDYVARAPSGAPARAGDDVAEVRWVPLDRIATMECTPRLVETLRAWGIGAPSADE